MLSARENRWNQRGSHRAQQPFSGRSTLFLLVSFSQERHTLKLFLRRLQLSIQTFDGGDMLPFAVFNFGLLPLQLHHLLMETSEVGGSEGAHLRDLRQKRTSETIAPPCPTAVNQLPSLSRT